MAKLIVTNKRVCYVLFRLPTYHHEAGWLGVGCWVLGVGCWVLGVGCWVLGVGCWVLGVGSWVLGVGCWVLGVGCWVLGLMLEEVFVEQRKEAYHTVQVKYSTLKLHSPLFSKVKVKHRMPPT
jgi:hypothetical protein